MHVWLLQLQNKQDWARLFGYEVHQMAELVDGHMRTGPWQKAGLLRKARLLCAPYTVLPTHAAPVVLACIARPALLPQQRCQPVQHRPVTCQRPIPLTFLPPLPHLHLRSLSANLFATVHTLPQQQPALLEQHNHSMHACMWGRR